MCLQYSKNNCIDKIVEYLHSSIQMPHLIFNPMSKVPTNYDFYLLIVPIKSLKTQNVLKSFIVGTFEYQTLEICKTDKYFSCFQLTQNTLGTLEKIFKARTEFLNFLLILLVIQNFKFTQLNGNISILQIIQIKISFKVIKTYSLLYTKIRIKHFLTSR